MDKADERTQLILVFGGFVGRGQQIGRNGDVRGPIYTSTNSGVTWSPHIPTNYNTVFFVWHVATSADGNKLVAAAGGDHFIGSIYVSSDAGATWRTTSAPREYWSSVASSADGTRLAAVAYDDGLGNGGPIYTSFDSGTTWTSNNVAITNWISVASSADGTKLVAVANGNTPYAPGPIYTSQTIPSPQLNITPSSSNLMLSWIVPATNFVLQQSSDLISWADVTTTPVLNLTNLKNEVILSPTNSSGFYRLKTP